MAYGQDVFQQKALNPYMGPAQAPFVAPTITPPKLPTPIPTPGAAPGVSGGVAGGRGGYYSMAQSPIMGNPVPLSPGVSAGQVGMTPANAPPVTKPGYTSPLPGSITPIPVPAIGQRKVDILGAFGVRKTAAQLTSGAARNAYTTAYNLQQRNAAR